MKIKLPKKVSILEEKLNKIKDILGE